MRLTHGFHPIFLPVLLFSTSALSAALLAGGDESTGQSSGSERSSPIKSISEIIESAGDLLIDTIRPEDEVRLAEPTWDSTTSPRDTVLTFIEAMQHVSLGRDEAWSRAFKTFPTNQLSDLEITNVAVQLKEVFDRIGPVRSMDLPGARRVEHSGITRLEVFPYALEHDWIWRTLGDAPEGTIVVERQDDGAWRFSEDTLLNMATLRQSLDPVAPRYERSARGQAFVDVFGPTFQQTPWWGWLALLGAIVSGTFLGRLGKRLVEWIAARVEERRWELLGGLVRGFGTPTSLMIFTFALIGGLLFVKFTPTLSTLRWDIVKLLLLTATGWLLFELIDLVTIGLRRSLKNTTEYTDMAVTLVRRALRVFFIVIFMIFVFQNVLGLNIAALITGLGLVGLAISLAGKDSAQNLFGALSIFINRPFAVGDWIRFRDSLGEVEDVGMQVSRVRLMSGELLVVPNMQFIDHSVENLSLRQFLRREMNIAITYDTKPEKIGEALKLIDEILRSDDVVEQGDFNLEEHPPKVSFSEFGDYSLNLRVYYWYYVHADHRTPQRRSERGWYSYLEHCSLVNRRIHEGFNAAGIEFAFPTQTLHMTRSGRPALNEGSRGRRTPRSSSGGGESRAETN